MKPRKTIKVHSTPRFVLIACVVLLAACSRQQSMNGDSPQVASAKAAVAHKLELTESVEFRDVAEYPDGVVCGEFTGKRRYSGSGIAFRKFIYNAPEPGALTVDSGDLAPQDIGYWCSDQPDKRLRMLTASVAELRKACDAAGGKSSDMNCRLAATQKQNLDTLVAEKARSAPASSTAPASQPGTPVSTSTAMVSQPASAASAPANRSPEVASAGRAPASTAVAAASPPQPAASGDRDAEILAEVGVALRKWRERWQDGDVDGYLRMYDPAFTGGAASHAAWEQQRRQKMKDARPSIRVERLQAVRITPQEAELRFVQVYAARQHQDKGTKTMVFRRSQQGWLIVDERWTAGG